MTSTPGIVHVTPVFMGVSSVKKSSSPTQEEQSKVNGLGQETEDRRRGRAVDIITSICSIIGFGLKVLFQSRARFLAWTQG